MKFIGGQFKKVLVIFAGTICLILGLLGLVLPFLQGILFIILGGVLLSLASRRIQAWIESRTRKYPALHTRIAKVQAWAQRIIGPLD